MKEPQWVLFEREILKLFPTAKATSGSGKTWSDGDAIADEICFEAKCHQRVSFDSWWKQTRLQAETYNKVPCLVIWRPPVELKFGPAIDDECLAVVPLWYLAQLKKELAEAKRQFAEMEDVNVQLEEYISELEGEE